MQNEPIGMIKTPSIDLVYYLDKIIDFFVSHAPLLVVGLSDIIGYVIGISIVVSVVLIIGIIYAVERLKYIRKHEDKVYSPKVDMGYETIKKANQDILDKWKKVTKYMESENESDWRQAILEADIMLGELLTKEGYQGESIGEQLRRVEKGDCENIDNAWEAHKIRNLIAHEGSNYPLSKYEARRIINLYNLVFKEFYNI